MGPAGPEFTESSSEESVTEEVVGTAAKSKARPPSPTTGTSESETAPNPSGKGGSAAEVVPADGPGKGKGKGKDRSVCQYCWQACSSFPSGRDQHQYYNMQCLTWQRYLRGGATWTQARNWAMQTKMDREDDIPPVGAPSSGSRPPPPPPPEPKRAPALKTAEHREHKVELREKKNRKEKRKRSRRTSHVPRNIRRRRS